MAKASETRASERKRVADWLAAKAEEVEALLKKAADRGDPGERPLRLIFATRTKVLLTTLAMMIGNNAMPLGQTAEEMQAKADKKK